MVYKILLGLCLLLILALHITLAAAQKRGDAWRVRVLNFFRLGLSLSAISYLLRLSRFPNHGLLVFFSFTTCLLGTAFLWLGWMEHWRLRNARLGTCLPPHEHDEPVSQTLADPLLNAGYPSPLTARMHQVLLCAQYEAHRRQDPNVDTDHLLLGLLCDAESAGMTFLNALQVSTEKVHLELLGQMAERRDTKYLAKIPNAALRAKAKRLPLTERADQVLSLAAQEAHRFESACVGTEHLLLGLVLVGKGKAAGVLFREGITVDRLREKISKRKPVTPQEAMNRPRLQER